MNAIYPEYRVVCNRYDHILAAPAFIAEIVAAFGLRGRARCEAVGKSKDPPGCRNWYSCRYEITPHLNL